MYTLTTPQPNTVQLGDYSPTCLFPDDHEPGHPPAMRFHCAEYSRQPMTPWEDLTEREIAERSTAGARFMLSSQFDFWWEDLGWDLLHVDGEDS